MHAKAGDWLVVQSGSQTHTRRGEIRAVPESGEPPFTVRWADTGREAIVFPGPEAHILTAEQVMGLSTARARCATRAQDAIRARRTCGA